MPSTRLKKGAREKSIQNICMEAGEISRLNVSSRQGSEHSFLYLKALIKHCVPETAPLKMMKYIV
jgi:hypothetical protein